MRLGISAYSNEFDESVVANLTRAGRSGALAAHSSFSPA